MRFQGIFRVLVLPLVPMALASPGAGMGFLGQVPAPLPKPKPIVTPPMPKPGQFSQRPKPPGEVVNSGGPEPTQKQASPTSQPENSPVPKQNLAGENKAPTPSYGTTPVPWPKGSTDPAHFPREIPRLQSARKASFSMSAQVASAYFLCDESPEEVARFYLDFATRGHWTLVPIPGPPLEAERIIIAEKGDWTLRVDASPDPSEGHTEVFLCASLKLLPPPPKPAEKQAGEQR